MKFIEIISNEIHEHDYVNVHRITKRVSLLFFGIRILSYTITNNIDNILVE